MGPLIGPIKLTIEVKKIKITINNTEYVTYFEHTEVKTPKGKTTERTEFVLYEVEGEQKFSASVTRHINDKPNRVLARTVALRRALANRRDLRIAIVEKLNLRMAKE